MVRIDDNSDSQIFYSITEAAKYCGVCRTTANNWIINGIIPIHRMPGSTGGTFVRIARDEIYVVSK